MTALRQALWPQASAPGGFLPHPTVHPEQISVHDSPPGTCHSVFQKLRWLPIAHLVQPQSNCPTFFLTMGLAANRPPHSCLGVFAHRPPFPHWEKPSPSPAPASSQHRPSWKRGSPLRLPPPRGLLWLPPPTASLFPLHGAHPPQPPFSKCFRRILLFNLFAEYILYWSRLRVFTLAVTLPRTKHPQLFMKMPLSSRRAQRCPQSCPLLHRWVFLDPPIQKSPPGTLYSRT